MDLGLDGQVVIVTGGASNIGKATSIEFAREGATVAILDRDEAMGKATAVQITESGGSAVCYPLDLTDVDATAAVAASVEADLGPVAALVNNVGWNGPGEFFLNLGPEHWDKVYRLNLFPTLNATKAVLPKMVERRSGSIVSISSDAGFGEFRMSDYGAMKAGVMSFMRTIAKEYGRYDIRANSVCPGLVIPEPGDIGEESLWTQDIISNIDDAEIAEFEANIPLRARPEAVDIATTVVYLSSAPARRLTGQVLSVSGGFAMPR